jgi:hypothetical protein
MTVIGNAALPDDSEEAQRDLKQDHHLILESQVQQQKFNTCSVSETLSTESDSVTLGTTQIRVRALPVTKHNEIECIKIINIDTQ